MEFVFAADFWYIWVYVNEIYHFFLFFNSRLHIIDQNF